MVNERLMGTFYDKESGKTYSVNEGNIVVSQGFSALNGVFEKYFDFSNRVNEECFLEFDTTYDLCVKGASSGANAKYITMYNPEFPKGKLPQESMTETVNAGSYQRFVTAFKMRPGEAQLPLVSNNAAISAGDSLIASDYKSGLKKDTTGKNKVIALESKPANAGGYIICELKEDYVPIA